MNLPLTAEFVQICERIVQEASTGKAWVWNEDEYQYPHFCGGWCEDDSKGAGFAMSYYSPDGVDYIFEFTLRDAEAIARHEYVALPLERWKDSPIGAYPPDCDSVPVIVPPAQL